MKMIWIIIPLILFVVIGIEKSFAEDLQINEGCIHVNTTKNPACNEEFRAQSMKVFSVVGSHIGVIEDPSTKLTLVDLGTFYGVGGNGTIPDKINIFRDNHLWRTIDKETGIAPSTSHSEWQITQTFFFNELPGVYKLVLITNNTETLVFKFMVRQITDEFKENSLEVNMKNNPMEENGGHAINSKMAPLKQIMHGVVPEDVKCNEGLTLIIRHNGSPACVTPNTAEKFEIRGLGIMPPPCCKNLHTDTSLEQKEPTSISSIECSGVAKCITGIVTQVTDGDTIKVDGQSVRFALSSAPELNESGGMESKEFIESVCPVGSTALVDEDDGQTQGSYGRIIGVIYCNGVNLNEELVESEFGYLTSDFCESSEFKTHDWAKKYGC
ncbi:MAG: thermonuclease family protein [Nitrosopumilus sp.]|nr:thermonuclease family protein [Nitrosopumilus sp.]